MKLKIQLFLVMLVFAASCKEDKDLILKEAEPKMVLNAVAVTGEPWIINLTQSKSLKDTHSVFFPVYNAIVEVFQNENYLETLVFDPYLGAYVGNSFPVGGFTYKIKASAPGFESIEAIEFVSIPKPVAIKQLILSDPDSVSGQMHALLTIALDNDPSGHEYMALRIGLGNPFWPGSDPLFVTSQHPAFSEVYYKDGENYGLWHEFFLSDKNLLPGENLIVFSFDVPANMDYNRVVVERFTTGRQYFDFVKTMGKGSSTGIGNSPTIWQSNVSNNLGFFGSMSGYSTEAGF